MSSTHSGIALIQRQQRQRPYPNQSNKSTISLTFECGSVCDCGLCHVVSCRVACPIKQQQQQLLLLMMLMRENREQILLVFSSLAHVGVCCVSCSCPSSPDPVISHALFPHTHTHTRQTSNNVVSCDVM